MGQRFRKRLAATVITVVSALGITLVVPPAANATIWWDAPAKCVANQFYQVKSGQWGYYTKAYEYTRQLSYGGGIETRYIWVWEVQVPIYPYGMVTAGRAEKHCGSTWRPTWA